VPVARPRVLQVGGRVGRDGSAGHGNDHDAAERLDDLIRPEPARRDLEAPFPSAWRSPAGTFSMSNSNRASVRRLRGHRRGRAAGGSPRTGPGTRGGARQAWWPSPRIRQAARLRHRCRTSSEILASEWIAAFACHDRRRRKVPMYVRSDSGDTRCETSSGRAR
jgi:hypothetical protein